jgi:hypothetical protein
MTFLVSAKWKAHCRADLPFPLQPPYPALELFTKRIVIQDKSVSPGKENSASFVYPVTK